MASHTSSQPQIKTRFLILSDTHGAKPAARGSSTVMSFSGWHLQPQSSLQAVTVSGYREPLPEADVVLHCGDITKLSRIDEFRDSFAVLRSIQAPLKLVMAGNHDLYLEHLLRTMDKSYKHIIDLEKIIAEAEQDGVKYLNEGIHTFNLSNGARLRLFASPYTPKFWRLGFPIRKTSQL